MSLTLACQPFEQTFATGNCPIVNGEPDTSPAHMAVVYLQMAQGTMGYGCSGTLIGPRVVLTAGHCVDESAPEDILVFFGNVVPSGAVRSVSEKKVHPSYHGVSRDIAMVRLSEDAPAGVVPIPYLPHSIGIYDADIGKPLEFVGFGVTETGASGAKMTVTNNLDWICTSAGGCNLPIGGGAWAVQNTICQDQRPGGPCSGDSGGPAFIKRSDKEYVAGITSYGDADRCQYYGCSTKVDEYEDFIRGFAGNPAGTSCSDDNECLSGNCEERVCCENACAGLCKGCTQPGFEGQCVPLPDGTPCPDNDLCNGDEACVGGSCQRGEKPVCHDSLDCTADTCDPAKGCDFKPLAADCDDGNICTRDRCDLEKGCIQEPLSDGLGCEKNKICLAGECVKDPNLDEGCGCGSSYRSRTFLCLLLLLPFLFRNRGGNRAA